jgi:serine/threonine-protein kinase
VSKGPPPVTVPSVTGKPVDQATSILHALGLNVTTTLAYSDKVAKDTVMSTSPPSGATLHKGDNVNLVVSRGPHLYPVPDVRGMKVDAAVAALKAAGFDATVSQFPGGPNRVLSQSPGPGSMQKRGTVVHLYAF